MLKERYIPAKLFWEMARIRAIAPQHPPLDVSFQGYNDNPELKLVPLMTNT
jgi:hypothetical protein